VGAADDVVLIDQHCHGVLADDADGARFRFWLTEADTVVRDPFESLLGLAVRRWCAPVLELPAHAEPDVYLRRRAELGWREVTGRLLRAAGVSDWLVDTGFVPEPATTPAEFGAGRVREVVRVEQVAEQVFATADTVAGLLDGIRAELRRRASGAVGLKSVVGYRTGLAVAPTAPDDRAVRGAAAGWLASGQTRLADATLLDWLVHEAAAVGAELSLPLQLHTGFGDPDLDLRQADPLLLKGFLQSTTGLSVVLLHCWPYHRNAAYLAHVFGHVSVDLGLTVPYVGARFAAVLGEVLELAPFSAVLYSSDGNGIPELHHLGAVLWRRGLGRLLDEWIAEDVVGAADAERLAHATSAANARRLYRI
jgi:uncharacterized protein